MKAIVEILKESGYSDKAIDFYINKVNFGEIKKPSFRHASTG